MTDPREIIERINELPTLPAVVAKVNSLVNSSAASAGDINEVISRDLALSTKVLKLVNSSFYGFPRRITSITHAVVILGFNTVRNLALSAFVFSAFKTGRKGFDSTAFWRHSIGTALGASTTAQVLGLSQSEKEDVFMAGLLHDTGKAVMCEYLPEAMDQVTAMVREKQCLFLDAEREVLDFNHAEIGGALLERWGLPEALVELVREHHTLRGSPSRARLIAIVHFADILARGLCIGNPGDNRIPLLREEAWELLELERDQTGQIMDLTLADVEQAGAFFDLV
jgi:putative nucleotidyltransferase with HDIG domain